MDILFYNAFQRMQLPYDQLQKINVSLVEFTINSIQVEEAINLPVIARTEPYQSTVKLTFLVVKVPSAYNAILERLGLNTFQAVVFTESSVKLLWARFSLGKVR